MIARSFHLKTLFTGIWILEVRMYTIRENDILAKLKKQDSIWFYLQNQRLKINFESYNFTSTFETLRGCHF